MNSMSLGGIDGQHLWGFLTALGSLSLLDEYAREKSLHSPRLAFKEDGTAVLEGPVVAQEHPQKHHLATVLVDKLKVLQRFLDGALADINKPSDFTRSSYESIARSTMNSGIVNLLAGLACVVGEEACESTLCAANGAGHQNLIQSMRDVLKLVEVEHVEKALFEPWKREYRVPDDKRKILKLGNRKPTLRLDPSDERLYALRFSNPTTTDDFSTELGAQALAIPAFALLPVVPGRQPVTIASKRHKSRVTFSWMLWKIPATLHTVRSLVWGGIGNCREKQERGVFAAFSVDRVSGPKGKLFFAPSKGIWWSNQ